MAFFSSMNTATIKLWHQVICRIRESRRIGWNDEFCVVHIDNWTCGCQTWLYPLSMFSVLICRHNIIFYYCCYCWIMEFSIVNEMKVFFGHAYLVLFLRIRPPFFKGRTLRIPKRCIITYFLSNDVLNCKNTLNLQKRAKVLMHNLFFIYILVSEF